jgi:hypothetical protein
MRELLLCSLVVVVVAGCGFTAPTREPGPDQPDASAVVGPDASAPDPSIDAPPGAPLTPDTYITKLISAECQKAFTCQPEYPPDAQQSFAYAWGSSMNDCVTTDEDYKNIPAISAAVAAGRITWDPASAAVCLLDPAFPASCATFFQDTYDWADSCYTALAGHVADGASCTTGWECSRHSMCRQGKCSPSQ